MDAKLLTKVWHVTNLSNRLFQISYTRYIRYGQVLALDSIIWDFLILFDMYLTDLVSCNDATVSSESAYSSSFR